MIRQKEGMRAFQRVGGIRVITSTGSSGLLQIGSVTKESACNAEDLGLIPGSEISPGKWNGNPLQYSCLEDPMNRGAWWATIHGVANSQTQLSDFHTHIHTHTHTHTHTHRVVILRQEIYLF